MGSATATDQTAIRLFAEQAAGGSGVLTVVQGKLKRLFCLERGDLVFAASNLIEEQLDEFLVQKELLTPVARAKAKAGAAREGKKIGPYLQDHGDLERAVLERAAQDHARQLLFSSLAAEGAVAGFDRGTPKLDGQLKVKLPCSALVLDHVRLYPESVKEVRVRIGTSDKRPAVDAEARKALGDTPQSGATSYLLEACDGSRNVTTLVEGSPACDEETLRALYGLMLLGVLKVADGGQEKKQAGGVTRDEALARLSLAQGADHYMVLGVVSTAADDEIRRAYYMIARRFHPDRFRAGELSDLLPRFEHYFTQVTEAYNTLAEPTLRKRYDEERERAEAEARDERPEHDTTYLARQNFIRAKTLLGKRQLQAAVTFLENAIGLDENNAAYHRELGKVLTGNPRRRDDAEEHLVRAAELDPTDADSHAALGQLYRKLDRKDDAIRRFREALQWEQAHAEARTALAELGVKNP